MTTSPLAGVGSSLFAQVTVTDITYGERRNDWNQNQGGVTFRQEYYPVESVSTGVGDYLFNGPLAQSVYLRRNEANSDWSYGGRGHGYGHGGHGGSDDNNDHTTLFYQTDSYDRAYGSAPDSAGGVFRDGNLFTGLRDPFANTGSSDDDLNTNIERIDFYFGDYVVTEGAGIVLFDLENFGNHGDAFRIAAFDGWDSSAVAPDSFANTGLLINPGSFGDALLSPTDNGSLEFARATYTDGDDVSGSASSFTSLGSDLNVVGILIRFTDLGLSVGDTIQGFSLMAPDVDARTSIDLVDWSNDRVYRTDTDRNTHGNIDFMGFGARLANPVPEPSAYGAAFMGLAGATLLVVRRRRGRGSLKPAA